jgi:hypothetical protein
MKKLKDVKLLAKSYGATCEESRAGNTVEVSVIAPKGRYWREGSVHELIECVYLPWKPDYDDIISRMNHGTEECIDPDCDWCHPIE